MNVQTCLKLLRQIRDVAFATVDTDNQPQVRIIDVMLVEEEKLYFCTARGKDFYQQLIAAKTVAVTGMNKKYQMVRVNGGVTKLAEQKKWLERIFNENPSMNEVYPGNSRYILEAFCLKAKQVEFFDLGVSPVFRQSFSLDVSENLHKGFVIGNNCIRCNKCAEACPQACIIKSHPYQIRQENCLHCGLCAEICPINTIHKEGSE